MANAASPSEAIAECFGRFHGYPALFEEYPVDTDVVDAYVPWISKYTARFTANMTDDDIKDIIQTLVVRAKQAVVENAERLKRNYVIMFHADYSSLGNTWLLYTKPEAVQLANRVKACGWGGLCALLTLWRVKSVRDVIADERFPLPDRKFMFNDSNITFFISSGMKPHEHIEIEDAPADESLFIRIFEKAFPDLDIRI